MGLKGKTKTPFVPAPVMWMYKCEVGSVTCSVKRFNGFSGSNRVAVWLAVPGEEGIVRKE